MSDRLVFFFIFAFVAFVLVLLDRVMPVADSEPRIAACAAMNGMVLIHGERIAGCLVTPEQAKALESSK